MGPGQKEKEERGDGTNKPLTDLAQNGYELSYSVFVLSGDHVKEKVLPSLEVYDKGLVVGRTDADSFDRGETEWVLLPLEVLARI